MSERERLPDRRGAELVDFEHHGCKWTATFGRFADGRIAEVFLTVLGQLDKGRFLWRVEVAI